MKKSDIDMRDAFLDELYGFAKHDKRIMFLSDDFGAPSLDKFKIDLPGQYINTGISEQNMISVAAGLALSGKLVYVYAIAPFASLRCFEQIKIDVCLMNLAVNILSVGAGYAYATEGPTHHAIEDIALMRLLPNMMILNPADSVIAAAFAEISYKSFSPKYIRFDRGKTSLIYDHKNYNLTDGLSVIREGDDLTIISTGTIVLRSLEVAEILAKHSIETKIVDLFRLKPINKELLLEILKKSNRIVVLEENFISGGLGSIIAEIFVDCHIFKPLKRIAITEEIGFTYGERESLRSLCGLDIENLTKIILDWVKVHEI